MQLGVISFFCAKEKHIAGYFCTVMLSIFVGDIVFVVVFLLLFVYSFVETMVRFVACRFTFRTDDFFS